MKWLQISFFLTLLWQRRHVWASVGSLNFRQSSRALSSIKTMSPFTLLMERFVISGVRMFIIVTIYLLQNACIISLNSKTGMCSLISKFAASSLLYSWKMHFDLYRRALFLSCSVRVCVESSISHNLQQSRYLWTTYKVSIDCNPV